MSSSVNPIHRPAPVLSCDTPALAAPATVPVFNLQIIAQTAGNPYDGQFIGRWGEINAVPNEVSALSLFINACGQLETNGTFQVASVAPFLEHQTLSFLEHQKPSLDPVGPPSFLTSPLTCSVSSADNTLSCDSQDFYMCGDALSVTNPNYSDDAESFNAPTESCLPIALLTTQIGTYCGDCASNTTNSTTIGTSTTSTPTTTIDYCAERPAQPTGSGPLTNPDTASAFLANPTYASIASAAPTPSGYLQTFVALNAENNAVGYMGYDILTTYDTEQCAANCNAKTGCRGINIAFERDPTVDPGTNCTNSASTTIIKCVYWSNPVTAETATNEGQWRDDFQVVVAGSNGYIQAAIPELPGYAAPEYYGNASINAPLDCQGTDTYMGFQSFTDGQPFDPSRCAAACAAENAWRASHPPPAGQPTTCAFFNTYWMLDNNGLTEQRCVKYSEHWGPEYAVNTGCTWGSDDYTILASVGYYSATSDGVPSQCSDSDPAQSAAPQTLCIRGETRNPDDDCQP